MKSKMRNRHLGSFKDGLDLVVTHGLDLVVTHRMQNLNMITTRVIFVQCLIEVADEVKKQIKKIGMRIKKKNLR